MNAITTSTNAQPIGLRQTEVNADFIAISSLGDGGVVLIDLACSHCRPPRGSPDISINVFTAAA
jgi:hypothetical protein